MARRLLGAGCFLCAVMGLAPFATAQSADDALTAGFRTPPSDAMPRTWWHWTRGNVSTDGITKDLEWMHRVGIGGFQLADVNAGGGQTIDKPLDFGTPEWLDAVKHAATEAERLGLEMTIFSSSGWSLTGGPWVKPEQAMKKLVWSETVADGGQPLEIKLPQPPSNNSAFRDIGAGGPQRAPQRDNTFYADFAVIAFPTPAGDAPMAEAIPKVTTSAGPLDDAKASILYDESYATPTGIDAPSDGGPAWLQYEFAAPLAARAITLAGPGGIPVGRVLASNDGVAWRPLVTLPGAQLYRQFRVRTFAFPEARARYFRFEFTAAPLNPAATMNQEPTAPAKSYALWEAQIHRGARVHRWQEKAGFGHLFEYESVPTPPVLAEAAIPADSVVNLTDKMADDGTLNWEAPAGRWTILRCGYSLTGAKNRPATPAGSGYEVDKLSRVHTTAYYEAYGGMLKKALGPLYGSGLKFFLLDSWEAGTQNWTDDMPAEFARRRGYDMKPYLPALAGYVVADAASSDRFLWDFRRTLADMFADNHYAVMHDLLKRDGLGTYSEASGVSLEIPEDTLLNKSKVDIPMGEFWVRDLHPRLMYFQDVRGAASAAHVYGKPFVGAESFTGGGYESPRTLKNVADYWLAQGINRLVFHTSAHQPLDTKPGNTMVGTHLNRNITWAEQAGPLFTYFARQCYMLQQGRFVADLVYLLDEGAPSTPPIWGAGTQPAPPVGYDYDFLNADALLSQVTVNAEGRLSTPSGMTYRALVLPPSRHMRHELIRKLHELAVGGATIVGPPPLGSPSLQGGDDGDREVANAASDLWGDLDGVSRTVRHVGKGRVVWGQSLEAALALLKLPPDFEFAAGLDAQISCLHRTAGDAEIYYVANNSDQPRKVDARFRVAGREAEIWRPDDGTMGSVDYQIEGERTTVSLALAERECVFIVFRASTGVASRTVPTTATRTIATLTGPWHLDFQPNLGAPASIHADSLKSWTKFDDAGIRYFSGTATYSVSFNCPDEALSTNAKCFLNLGEVRDLAEVRLNGKSLGVLWKPPYRVDVSALLKPGEDANKLEIAVTNEWTNRIMGDGQAAPDKRVLSSNAPPGLGGGGGFGRGPREPLTSGLLGPVTIEIEQPIPPTELRPAP